MGLLLFLYVLSVAAVTYTPYVSMATGAVILSADALPIPGGYVVPERRNVTFNCSSSLGGILVWRMNLTTLNNVGVPVTTSGLNRLPGFSSKDNISANPASFTFHNISLENSPSIVECVDSNEEVSKAIILVEGSPNCPTVHTTVTATSLTITIQKGLMMWLPEWYCVEAISYNGSIAYNSSLKCSASVNVTSLQPGTVYNISVIPCNMAGCNKSCNIHLVQTESDAGIGEPGSDVIPHGDSLPLFVFIIIAVAILVAMALLAIIGSMSVVCVVRRRGNKQKGAAEQGCMKLQIQPSQPMYGETTMICKAKEISSAVNKPEYAEVAHSTKSAKGQSSQGPPRQAHSTYLPGTGASPTEYATVADAVSVEKKVSGSQTPLKHTPSQPPSSPASAQPCSSADADMHIECVQDAGYASLPDSQGSKRITKVRSIKQKTNQMHASNANSPANMC